MTKLHDLVAGWWRATRARRDELPWRSTSEPWAVLVSETMLAQTPVSRVAGRYPEMLARYPSPAALAAAPLGELLRAWSGLGYPRRAAALHAAATALCKEHGGAVPARLEQLLALPGVGPYTARAVLALAFGQPVGMVETNIGRVLARAHAARPLTRRPAQELADHLTATAPLPPREWNLALMDFGAVVCRARSPGCEDCAVRAAEACAWRASAVARDPALGSAGVSGRQAPFAGSDRQARGRLLAAACSAPVPKSALAALAGCPGEEERARSLAAGLVAEGLLAAGEDGSLRLP